MIASQIHLATYDVFFAMPISPMPIPNPLPIHHHAGEEPTFEHIIVLGDDLDVEALLEACPDPNPQATDIKE